MQQLILSSSEVYTYLFEMDKISKGEVLSRIWNDYDFQKVLPIPVYNIPEELEINGWKYLLPDGNHRWLYGHVTAGKVAAILLLPDERIQIEEWGMAPFRKSNDPDLYNKTLRIYCYQQGILR